MTLDEIQQAADRIVRLAKWLDDRGATVLGVYMWGDRQMLKVSEQDFRRIYAGQEVVLTGGMGAKMRSTLGIRMPGYDALHLSVVADIDLTKEDEHTGAILAMNPSPGQTTRIHLPISETQSN